MTYVVFLLPANIRGVYHYDMRSRPYALRPARDSEHANPNIAYLGSPGFSFDELCRDNHDFAVFANLADAESYFSTGIFRPISQATPAVATLHSRHQLAVDIFAPSTRLDAIDTATASSDPIRADTAPQVTGALRIPGSPPPERASAQADTDDPPSQTQDLGTVLPANRVSRVVGSGTPDYPVFPEVTLPDPDIRPARPQRCASPPSRERRTAELGRHDEFADAYSPAAAYNALYTDSAFPDTSFEDANYTQSPASRTSSSLFTSPTFLSLCTCAVGVPPCLAHTLLLADPRNPTSNVSIIRQNRRLVRVAAAECTAARQRTHTSFRPRDSPRRDQSPQR